MIKDKIDEYLDSFKKRQDHLAGIFKDGYSASEDDVAASDDVAYIKGTLTYIVDDGEVSYLVVNNNSCNRLEPFFELSDECVNLGVDTHQAVPVPGPGTSELERISESVLIRLIPAKAGYDFKFIESGDIQNLIDSQLVSRLQAYLDDLIQYAAGYTEHNICSVLPQLNAQLQEQADELGVSFETIASHEGTLKLFARIINELIVEAASKYVEVVDQAYEKLVTKAIGKHEILDDVVGYGVMNNSDASEMQIDSVDENWEKISLFRDWPDGDVEASLALLMSVAIEKNMEYISEVMEGKLANSIIQTTRMLTETAASIDMETADLARSSFMRVAFTRNMNARMAGASEEAMSRYEEESFDEEEEMSISDAANEAEIGEGIELGAIKEIVPNSTDAYVAACAAVMVCDNQVDQSELMESLKAALKSKLVIELVESLAGKGGALEDSLTGLTAEDYRKVLEHMDSANQSSVDEAATGVIEDRFNTLLEEFDTQAVMDVIDNVKSAWVSAQEIDSEYELLDIIAGKIGNEMSSFVMSSCLDIAKADGEFQGEEQIVLEYLASKWGLEENLSNMVYALTGKSWSKQTTANLNVVMQFENDGDVSEEQPELTGIWHAVEENDTEKAIALIKVGAPVNAVIDVSSEIRDMSPLMFAAEHCDNKLVLALIDAGADINAKASIGYVPLTWALKGDNLENFNAILSAGADPDPLESREGGYSPLSMAAKHGLEDAVKNLLAHRVNINWENDGGLTALKEAVMGRHGGCVKLLLDGGADPSKADDEGFSPLHNAARNGDIDIINMLLDAGVDANTPLLSPAEDEGETAINVASYAGHFDVVKLLVNHGAELNEVGDVLQDAIVGAYNRSEDPTELVEYLINNGKKVSMKALLHAVLMAPVPAIAILVNYLTSKADSLPDGYFELASKLLAEALSKMDDEARRKEIVNIFNSAGSVWGCDDLDFNEFDSKKESGDDSVVENDLTEESRESAPAVNYMPEQAELDLDVDIRSGSLSDDQFDDRWNRLIDIQNKISNDFVDELAEYQNQLEQDEYDTLMLYVGAMQDQNSHINETITTATNRDLGRYAKSIKNAALVTLGLCQKYRVFNDVDTYGYDTGKKMIQINGEDFYHLG